MNDLISRQAAINAADRADYRGLTVEDVKKVTDEVVKELKQIPTADVVEVVRCKYCKWHGYLTCSNPEGPKGWVTDECFCSFAERRNDECY